MHSGGLMTIKRPDVLQGETIKRRTGCGNLYVTVNTLDDKPFEIFLKLGKNGCCANCMLEAVARLISYPLRNHLPLKEVHKQILGLQCPVPMWHDDVLMKSCIDVVASVLNIYIQKEKINEERQKIEEKRERESTTSSESSTTNATCNVTSDAPTAGCCP
jgi:ribonucleoside-diphosphate reductase alpha chain